MTQSRPVEDSPTPNAPEAEATSNHKAAPKLNPTKTKPLDSNRPWFIALFIVLLLGGASAGGWFWWQSTQQGRGAAQAQQRSAAVPVTLGRVTEGTVQDTSEFLGNLEAKQAITVRPEIEGRISEIAVADGDEVDADAPLFQIDPDKQQAEVEIFEADEATAQAAQGDADFELQALEQDLLAAEAEVEFQDGELQRIQQLVSDGALPQRDLDQVSRDAAEAQANVDAIFSRIDAARSRLEEAEAEVTVAEANTALSERELQDTEVIAPFSGVIGDIPIKLGDYVSPGDTLTTLIQNEQMDLRLAIPVERRADLQKGLPVEIRDAQGNVLSVGEISFISPRVDSAAQTILAKATFDNPDGLLLDRQFVRARVIWSEAPGVLVPTSAVSRIAGQPFVFVYKKLVRKEKAKPQSDRKQKTEEDSKKSEEKPKKRQVKHVVEQRLVKLGQIQGDSYHVLEGLKPGERIVVSGILNLSDGSEIRPAKKKKPSGEPEAAKSETSESSKSEQETDATESADED